MTTDKQRLTLYVSGDLVRELKVRAIDERSSVSKLTEKLWRDYLGIPEGAKPKRRPRKPNRQS